MFTQQKIIVITGNDTPGERCIKWTLLVISFGLMLTGVLISLIGISISTLFGDYSDFIDHHFFLPPALLVAVGIITLVVSLFGCFAANKHSSRLWNTYGCLLCFIFILEVSAAIAAFCLQGQIRDMLIRTMEDSMRNYETSTSNDIDHMQSGLGCCGIICFRDWKNILNKTENVFPESCCTDFSTKSKDIECVEIYSGGCLIKMEIIIAQSAILIWKGAFIAAFVQFFGIICAFRFAKTIRRNKTVRDARCQLQQNHGITLPGKLTSPSEGYVQMENSGMNITRSESVTYTAISRTIS